MRKKLEKILDENQGTITAAVIEDALDYDDGPQQFFEDLLEHGSMSGMIASLIYYADIHKFYDTHYNEIEDIRLKLQEEGTCGYTPINMDLKNHYAWFAYEYVAYNIYNELEMEGS